MFLINPAALAILGGLALSVLGSPLDHSGHVIHEKRDVSQHSGWIKRDRISGSIRVPLRIGLAQRNLDRGQELLMDVSDPASPNYGKHWTAEQVIDMFSPSKDTVAAVHQWLTSAGVEAHRIGLTASKGWLTLNATIDETERLLDTEYYLFEHETEGHHALGCDEYKIPKHLTEHVDFVHPGVKLAGAKVASRTAHKKRALSPATTALPSVVRDAALSGGFNTSDCYYSLATPECIQRLYNVPPPTKAHPNNSLGIFEWGSWYGFKSLDVFFANFSPSIPQGTRPLNKSIDLSQWHYDDDSSFNSEADLDLEIAYPLIYPQTITVYQTDDDEYTHGALNGKYLGLFQDWLDAIDGSYCNYSAFGETGNDPVYDPPYPDNFTIVPSAPTGPWEYNGTTQCGTLEPTNVISLSYGWTEGLLPAYYSYRQCNEFMKLSLQGMTVVAASGDSGSSVTRNCGFLGIDYYHAAGQYPSNCPYVLSVGATMLTPCFHEVAANPWENSTTFGYASSGGFSRNYTRPAYQEAAVAAYFAEHKPTNVPDDAYDANGRGFPDVSALGWGIASVSDNGARLDNGGGTSASAPIVASLLNRVNEERLAVGKGPVGFVNPVFYAHPEMFTDVVKGNNSICGQAGFEAVKGWDPVTGLGTPKYDKMLEVFMALP